MSQPEAQSSKVFVCQVLDGRVLLQEGCKVWIQGLLVAISQGLRGETIYHVDDGTGVVRAIMKEAIRKRTMAAGRDYAPGAYLLVIGKVKRPGGQPSVLVHNMIDLSGYPDREATWSLQVIVAQGPSDAPGRH